MSTKSKLLQFLNENTGKFVSGQEIANSLGISRAAVNKAADALKKSGYNIQSRTKMGYRLFEELNLLTKESIESHMKTPCKIIALETVDSTNNYAKNEDISSGPVAVIADCQTAGRGRLGRTFASPKGTGIYVSITFKPNFDLDKSLFVTMAAAVGCANAIEEVTGISPRIKWVNDLFYKGKKICGILTEAQTNFETGKIEAVIIGVGVNCFRNELPAELQNIAGFLADDPKEFSRSKLAAAIIDNILTLSKTFLDKKFMMEYKKRSFILGKTVQVHNLATDETVKARALDIDDNGGLIVEYMEGRHMREIFTITSGEISLIPETF